MKVYLRVKMTFKVADFKNETKSQAVGYGFRLISFAKVNYLATE